MSGPALQRSDHLVPGESGSTLYVREVRPADCPLAVPILLLHGARVPGVASFDLDVPGGSLAADLALAGHTALVMDARGYGRSTRPSAMQLPPSASAPLARSDEVVRDVAAVVDWACGRLNVPQVALFGWATGGHWLGMYAGLFPQQVSQLVMFNTLYGGTVEHSSLGHGSTLEDPARPGQFNAAIGAWRYNTAESLLPAWDASIPDADTSRWRDPAVVEAYLAAALASDATSATRTPPSFRAPSGALEDSFYLATGRQLWDASLIRAPTLILRSEADFWSRPADVEQLVRHLAHAPRVRAVTLPGATHFAHLDRSDRGRAQLLRETLAFLAT